MAKFLEIAAENPRGLTWEVMNQATHSGVAQGDATNLPLPYSDNQFFGVYSEHFIEHIYKYQGINFFKDVMRMQLGADVVGILTLMHIEFDEAKFPRNISQRRYNPEQNAFLCKAIPDMVRSGILEELDSPFAVQMS